MHIEFVFNGLTVGIKLTPSNGRERQLLNLALSQVTSDCKWSVSMTKGEPTPEFYTISITHPEGPSDSNQTAK